MLSVCIASSEGAFVVACRDVIDELSRSQHETLQCVSAEASSEASVYLWDEQSGAEMPQQMSEPGRAANIVVVSKLRLPLIRSKLPHNEFHFLQSPATKAGLRIVIASALSRLGRRRGKLRQTAFDRDQLLQQLLEANARLQEHERNRSNLLMRLVHDLRSPLMAAQGYSGLLLSGAVGHVNTEQHRIIEKIQKGLDKLAGLAGTIADLSADATLSGSASAVSNELETCTKEAVSASRPFAKQKQISVKISLEPPRGAIYCDSSQMRHALINLLDNSCKFTPKHGSIEIRGYSISTAEMHEAGVAGRAAGYRIDVIDSGPSIPFERAENIFDEDAAYTGSTDRAGAGLGLAMCRMIISAHNGRIWATPGGPGAKFSFVLPYVQSGDSY